MTQATQQTCEFYVNGMHCPACEYTVETQLNKHQNIASAKATLSTQKVVLHIKDSQNKDQLKEELNSLIKNFGYSLQEQEIKQGKVDGKQTLLAFLMATGFALFFSYLQKVGLVNFLNSNEVTLPFVFLIGIVASLSTCMAVVGGLVLSLASTYSKSNFETGKLKIVSFHLSRLVSFFILGGVIGLLGSAFTLTENATFILNLVLFGVMLIMGINLLDIFPAVRNLQLKMPKSISQKFSGVTNDNKYAPILLGISTFFLPCGFTQSMQIYSLSTGSYINGAFIMLVFALGTLPVLSLISFASIKMAKGLQSGLFFKTAGFIVIFFAILNFMGALISKGYLNPIFNF